MASLKQAQTVVSLKQAQIGLSEAGSDSLFAFLLQSESGFYVLLGVRRYDCALIKCAPLI